MSLTEQTLSRMRQFQDFEGTFLNLTPVRQEPYFEQFGISNMVFNDYSYFVSLLLFKKIPDTRMLIDRAYKITRLAIKYFDDIESFKPVIVGRIPEYFQPYLVKYLLEDGFSVFYPYYVHQTIKDKAGIVTRTKVCTGFISHL